MRHLARQFCGINRRIVQNKLLKAAFVKPKGMTTQHRKPVEEKITLNLERQSEDLNKYLSKRCACLCKVSVLYNATFIKFKARLINSLIFLVELDKEHLKLIFGYAVLMTVDIYRAQMRHSQMHIYFKSVQYSHHDRSCSRPSNRLSFKGLKSCRMLSWPQCNQFRAQ